VYAFPFACTGWTMVPVKPTEDAGNHHRSYYSSADRYREMHIFRCRFILTGLTPLTRNPRFRASVRRVDDEDIYAYTCIHYFLFHRYRYR